MTPPEPVASGPAMPGTRRLAWEQVPAGLRAEAERLLGARVTAARTQPGGFSPGAAARLELDNGGRAFAKATGTELNPDSARFHRREARIAAALPAAVPAPRLLGTAEDGGWVLLLFEDADAALPELPWRPGELARVLDAMTGLAAALDPAPLAARPVTRARAGIYQGWRQLLADGAAGAGLDPWARAHLADLAALEAGWAGAAAGTALAHGDIRSDNVLLSADRVLFVDWPHACLAAPWFDLVSMLPSVTLQGGPPPEAIAAAHPLTAAADQAAVTAVVAATAGYFARQSGQPAPPGIPTVREFQAAQGRVALDWLRARTGWA
jgi:hypothetical protein